MTDLHDLLTRNDNKGRERMDGFWIIFVEHTDGGRHYKHSTLSSAMVEAERLARLPENAYKSVYVFECTGICKAEQAPVKWEGLDRRIR